MYEPPAANSQAMSCPFRASFAHFECLAGFCSSQKFPLFSVKERRFA